ncbi:MAG: signal peptidase I [Thermaerobacter sp.]|nr:signal peptidase I [Thermaerobacter sp.]
MLGRQRRKALRDAAQTIVVAVVLALVIRTFLVEPFVVDGVSMENTLQNNERLLVNKLWFHFSPLHYGEIVIFQPPIPGQPLYVKRVIATSGQTISMVNGKVFVNGRAMPQPFLVHHGVSTQDHWNMPPFKVPKGDIFVLGDHRAESRDSRYFGPVSVNAVQGVAFWVIWPIQQFGPVPSP